MKASEAVQKLMKEKGISFGDVFETFDDQEPLWDDIIFALERYERGEKKAPTYRAATKEEIDSLMN